MSKHTGYLIGLDQPKLSGVATAYFTTHKEGGSVHQVFMDAGHGVRQLIAAFINAGFFPTIPTGKKAPKVTYTVDASGVLQSIHV